MRRSAAGWRLLALGSLCLLLVACARLPDGEPPPSFVVIDTEGTALGRAVAALAADQPGRSGVHLLGNPRRALATLLGLADAAERSLDLQYCAWHTDTTGWLLMVVHDGEPDAGLLRFLGAGIVTILPLDWLLCADARLVVAALAGRMAEVGDGAPRDGAHETHRGVYSTVRDSPCRAGARPGPAARRLRRASARAGASA